MGETKTIVLILQPHPIRTFSILERIDVGEATAPPAVQAALLTFSILERIDVGETTAPPAVQAALLTFSILERIDVGETKTIVLILQPHPIRTFSILERIDVGETDWRPYGIRAEGNFQYPRTDRRG